VLQFAQDAIQGVESDYDRAVALKEAIEKQVKYNLNAPAVPVGQDPVDTFLFETKEGYCDLFATAMAQMARAVGIPARVATGFWPNEDANADGYYVLRESDYHMWAEIYFEGIGWMPFDPTEGAEAVPGSERGSAREDPKPWYEQRWVQDALEVGVIAIIGGIILLSIRGLFVRREPVAKRIRSQAGKLYSRFQRDLEKRTGKPRRLSQTPREYLDRVRGELPQDAAAAAEDVTLQFENALWSKDDPGDEERRSGGRRAQGIGRGGQVFSQHLAGAAVKFDPTAWAKSTVVFIGGNEDALRRKALTSLLDAVGSGPEDFDFESFLADAREPSAWLGASRARGSGPRRRLPSWGSTARWSFAMSSAPKKRSLPIV